MRRTGKALAPGFFARVRRQLRSEAAKKRTPARQAQAMGNLAKMRAALKEKGYPTTPKKRAASCVNLGKWRTTQGEEKARLAAALKQPLPTPSSTVQGAHDKVLEKAQGTIQRSWESPRRGGGKRGAAGDGGAG